MGHPDQVEHERIRGHPDTPFPIRPSQKLITFMLENRRFEDTLFAITDGTSHHTIVASNAGGKFVQEGSEVFDGPSKLLKKSISFFRPPSNDPIEHLAPQGRLIL